VKKPDEILTDFQKELDATTDTRQKVEMILEFGLTYGDNFGDKMIDVFEEGIKLSREIGFKGGEVICYYNVLFFTGMTKGAQNGKYNLSVEDATKLLLELEQDSEWYPLGLNQLAFFHWFRGEYEKGFNIIFESTRLSGGGNYSLAWNHFGLAVFYFDTKDYSNAKKAYQKSFELFDSEKHRYGRARAANGLASIAIIEGKPKEALELLNFCISVYRDLSHHSGLSRAVNDLGILEKTNKNFPKAIALLKESAELRKEINHLQGLATSYTELGEVFLLSGDYHSALAEFEKGLKLSIQVNSKQKQMRLHKLLYDIYKELKNTDLALENLEKYYEIKSQLLSDEATNNIKKIQTRFEKEKSEREAEIERLKNVELKKAYKEIEEKNKEIIDSITYATRIQQSLMPTELYIGKNIERLKSNSKD
jgi:tetratricopeptide (TPR) repeat protein